MAFGGGVSLALLPTFVVLMLGGVEAFSRQRLLFASLASSAFLIYLDPEHPANSVRTVALAQTCAVLLGFGRGFPANRPLWCLYAYVDWHPRRVQGACRPSNQAAMGPEIIVFDLNGTLLDLSALDGHFARLFGSAIYREKWFEQMQVLWMTTIATSTYQPFEKVAKAAMKMLASKESVELSSADEKAVVSQMTELPAFAEVPAALSQLHRAGFRLVALTNGARKSALAQVEFAGIADAFEAVFSTDEVERFKPAPEPYLHVAKRLGVKPGKLLMVAAHAWDVAGAYQAGLASAFVARPRQVLNPLATTPDYTVKDLAELVTKLC